MSNPFDRPTTYAPCVNDILYWVAEREAIRIYKFNGIDRKFWTQDPILAKYRFCNVRRRDDRVSQWLINNLYQHYDGEDLWFVSCIARYVNWPPTLLRLAMHDALPASVEEFNPKLFADTIMDLAEDGTKVWGSAYMLYPSREKGTNKAETVARTFLLPLVRDAQTIREAVAGNRVEGVVKALSRHFGWSTFMSGQVAADLTGFDLAKAEDLYEWAPMGPGSQRGLNRLFGYKLNHLWKQEDFNQTLMVIWQDITEQLDLDELTLHDVQSVMCELDKYWRTLNNEGSPRSIYVPEEAY